MARSPASVLKKRWLIGAVCGVALLVAFGSFYRVVLDESLSIEPGSLTYHLLVPSDLKVDRLAKFGAVKQYRRSAAGGPKPTITVASITVDGSGDAAIQAITAAFVALGYAASSPGHLVRGDTELDASFEGACASGRRVDWALSRHE